MQGDTFVHYLEACKMQLLQPPRTEPRHLRKMRSTHVASHMKNHPTQELIFDVTSFSYPKARGFGEANMSQ